MRTNHRQKGRNEMDSCESCCGAPHQMNHFSLVRLPVRMPERAGLRPNPNFCVAMAKSRSSTESRAGLALPRPSPEGESIHSQTHRRRSGGGVQSFGCASMCCTSK